MSLPGPGGSPGAGLVCAICLYVREDVAEDAVTVLSGIAVCVDHLGLVSDVQGSAWASILVIAGRRVREGMPFTPTASPARPAEE